RYESYYRNLSSILRKVFDAIPDTAQILNMDIFTQFMDMFRDEPVRKQSAQLILEAFVARHRTGVFSDLNLAHQVIDICKRLHDSVGAYSAENDVDEAARLIQAALDRFSLDADPEQALTFLVSCRASLMNIDQIQKYIVLRIIALSLYVIRSAKYSSSRSAFLQACLANLYITIPSLSDPLQRLQLNVQSTQVAFAALAFLQVDAFLEATLDCFDELDPSQHAAFRSQGVYFLSLMVQIPTFDENAPLNVFRRFLATVEKFQWPSSFHADRSRLLLACLQYLFAVASCESSLTGVTSEWSNVSASAEQQAIVDECIDHVVDLLLPTVKNDSTERPLLSIEFLEVFANYDGNVSHA
ncbi:hypothetical protein AAVH_40318, partial [Aphelenchoides avenae]